MAVDTDSDRTIEATVSADLAVSAMLEGTEPRYFQQIEHDGGLPDLPVQNINMYGGIGAKDELHQHLAQMLRDAFARW